MIISIALFERNKWNISIRNDTKIFPLNFLKSIYWSVSSLSLHIITYVTQYMAIYERNPRGELEFVWIINNAYCIVELKRAWYFGEFCFKKVYNIYKQFHPGNIIPGKISMNITTSVTCSEQWLGRRRQRCQRKRYVHNLVCTCNKYTPPVLWWDMIFIQRAVRFLFSIPKALFSTFNPTGLWRQIFFLKRTKSIRGGVRMCPYASTHVFFMFTFSKSPCLLHFLIHVGV